MISLLLLPLLLLPSVQGQTCDMAQVEERLARMEERMDEMKVEMKEELEEKKTELREEMKEKEAVLRKELASKEEVGMAVTQGLRDLPYLTLCSYKFRFEAASSTIPYDSFLTDFTNGDRPGGADGQLDLETGVFTCLSAGIYSVTFSGFARLEPATAVAVWLYLNGVKVPESLWETYAYYGAIDGRLSVPGSRSLVSVHCLCRP